MQLLEKIDFILSNNFDFNTQLNSIKPKPNTNISQKIFSKNLTTNQAITRNEILGFICNNTIFSN